MEAPKRVHLKRYPTPKTPPPPGILLAPCIESASHAKAWMSSEVTYKLFLFYPLILLAARNAHDPFITLRGGAHMLPWLDTGLTPRPVLTGTGQTWVSFGRFGPMPAELWPTPVRLAPHLADVQGTASAEIRPTRDPRPKSSRRRPASSQVWPTHGHRPTTARGLETPSAHDPHVAPSQHQSRTKQQLCH